MDTTTTTTTTPTADLGVETRPQLAIVGAYAASVVRGHLLSSGLAPSDVEAALGAMLEAPTPILGEVLIPRIIPEDPTWRSVGVWQFDLDRRGDGIGSWIMSDAAPDLVTGIDGVVMAVPFDAGLSVVVDTPIGKQVEAARAVSERLASHSHCSTWVGGDQSEALATALDPAAWRRQGVPGEAVRAATRILVRRQAHQCGWWDPLLARYADCHCHDA